MAAIDVVIDEITKFRRSSVKSPWKNIPRVEYAEGLEYRVRNPDKIDTSHLNLCGPGAFFRDVARDNPMLYARYAIDIYETGRAEFYGHKIVANDALLNVVLSGQNAAIDFVTLASWQNSENTFVGFTSETDGFGGITLPGALADWHKSVGYANVENSTNIYFTKGFDHLLAASKFFDHGYRVCLFINAKMLYSAEVTSSSFCPDHWVTLESPVQVVKRSGVQFAEFDAWCWGRTRRIPETGFVSAPNLTNNYYGFVAARP